MGCASSSPAADVVEAKAKVAQPQTNQKASAPPGSHQKESVNGRCAQVLVSRYCHITHIVLHDVSRQAPLPPECELLFGACMLSCLAAVHFFRVESKSTLDAGTKASDVVLDSKPKVRMELNQAIKSRVEARTLCRR